MAILDPVAPHDKVPPRASRFRRPLSILYVPPWLRSPSWVGLRDHDYAGPAVLETPLFVLRLIKAVLRPILYVGLVLARALTLPFRRRRTEL